MSARDLINAACAKANAWRDRTYASAVLDELIAAGYVILSPDEARAVKRVVEIANRNETSPEGSLLASLLKGDRDVT